MPLPATKTQLTAAQATLLQEMQRINYGRIERLTVRMGEPVMYPLPRMIREIKFGGENGPRLEAAKPDFALKAQVLDLFSEIRALRDGVISCIEIQRGLPFRMIVEEVRG